MTPPDSTDEKTHVWFWPEESTAGQEWAGGSISEQTRLVGATKAAKYDLPVDNVLPYSQESSSSSHHSDESMTDDGPFPPTARSLG